MGGGGSVPPPPPPPQEAQNRAARSTAAKVKRARHRAATQRRKVAKPRIQANPNQWPSPAGGIFGSKLVGGMADRRVVVTLTVTSCAVVAVVRLKTAEAGETLHPIVELAGAVLQESETVWADKP